MVLLFVALLASLAVGVAWAESTPPTWNPWGKESPEPYGYDVATAPDLPLGFVDPNDPPASLTIASPTDPFRAALDVVTSIDRTAYSWYGRVTVTADVSELGSPVLDCDSVLVVSSCNPRVRARVLDNGIAPDAAAGDGRYSGYFNIGAGEGEARPTGSYTLTATAYRSLDVGSDASPSFSLYSVRRWTGITTTDLPDASDDYTAFFVTSNGTGAGYHHAIREFGLVRSTSVADAQIRIPILPATNTISNLTVTGTGVSNVTVENNVIAFACNLTSATVSRVTIEFDAPSDLAATRIDRYQTGDIGLRDFRNGYLVWNRQVHTAIFGSGFSSPHGPGCIADLHVTDLATGDAHTVDCMERVAVHLDNIADDDGTGTYQSNIKWGGDALSWLESADLESMVFRFTSGGSYGLQDKARVERRVEFFADRRYFHHRYVTHNIDALSHDFDFVWGREQWLYGSAAGSNRQNRDRGMLPNDPASYGGEHRFDPSQVDGNWFVAFDESSYYSIGVLLAQPTDLAMPTYVHLLCDPALGNFPGQYPIIPSGTCTDMPNLFFEKALGVLAPGDSAGYEFYQWGGYGNDRQELTSVLWEDADAVAADPAAVGDPIETDLGGDDLGLTLSPAWPNPFSTSTEITFELAERSQASLAVYDVQGRFVESLLHDALAAGRHVARWSGRDRQGVLLPSGVYYLRLWINGQAETRTALLSR